MEQSSLRGEKVALVPYMKEMVPIYHKWLQDPYIMEMTCTDETTIESEHENQASYSKVNDKLIFLVVDLNAPEVPSLQPNELMRTLLPEYQNQ